MDAAQVIVGIGREKTIEMRAADGDEEQRVRLGGEDRSGDLSTNETFTP